MSTDKEQATRLADALERGGYLGNACNEAAALLRRWPDGKPVEYQILVNGGGWRRCAKHIYDVAIRTGAGTVRALYTAPPDQSERIAALEAALEQARVALERIRHATAPTHDDGGHHEAAHDLSIDALRAIEEVQHG